MNAYYLEKPQQQRLWRVLATTMHATSTLDQRLWGYQAPHKMIFLISYVFQYFGPVAMVSQIAYAYINFDHMASSQIEAMLIMIGLNILVVKLISREKYTRWTAGTLAVCISADIILYCAVPIYHNIRNKEFIANKTAILQTSIYLVMPFDYGYNYKNWLIMHCINTYSTTVAGYLLIVFDVVNYAIVFHVIGHIEILKHKMAVFSDAVKSLNEREDKVTAVIYTLMFSVFMGGLVLMSFILEEIRKKTDGLSDMVYSLPWETMSLSNQKMMILILARVQPQVSFVGAGGMRTGVQPMIGIMKSTFSYYVMLKKKV
ncbi:hypothetical protein JYU34_008816 [Plutella xylostella]|uniref:Odorant receptor n=1 Tax=Plutella xylostella TaxID=51655 RepID=A0ABQ7QMP5_PLUXY|nr:hypothetical protein JYU34_008816 [Plutella xylostella]